MSPTSEAVQQAAQAAIDLFEPPEQEQQQQQQQRLHPDPLRLTGEPFQYSILDARKKKIIIDWLGTEERHEILVGGLDYTWMSQEGGRLFGTEPSRTLELWIGDETIDVWGAMLQEAANSWLGNTGLGRFVVVLSTHFATFLLKGPNDWMDFVRKKRLAQKLGCTVDNCLIDNVYQADLVMFHVHVAKVHWAIIALDFVDKVLYLLDPMVEDAGSWVTGSRLQLKTACIQFLEHGGHTSGRHPTGWSVHFTCTPPLPGQQDAFNCGPLVCAYMHHLVGNRRATFASNCRGMAAVRWFIGHSIFSKKQDPTYVVPV